MNRYLRLPITAVVYTLLSMSFALAQAPAPTAPPAPSSSIKLQVVLSRYDGDKKISNLPYTLLLSPGVSGSLRAGAEVAVPTSGVANTNPGYTFQQVGKQIDAVATPTADGKFKLALTVTDRSIITGAPATQRGLPNVPSFRNNMSASTAVLSNGETVQFTSSADMASNETFKIDVTLTVGNK